MRKLIAVLGLAGLPVLALAQTPDPSAVDPVSLIGALVHAVQGHNWIIAIGLALSGIIWILRTQGGKVWPFLLTSRGGAALTLVVAVLGAVGTARSRTR